MDTLLQDIRYALRQLAARPAFTAVAVLTLALGIGANTAIFSVADGVLLRPLPYERPDRLVLMWEATPQLPFMVVAYPDYLDWRHRGAMFSGLAVYNRYGTRNLTGESAPERLAVGLSSANLFRVLGVRSAIGRSFVDGDDEPAADRVAMLSAGLWRRRFGADSGVVGRRIVLDGDPYVVIGVLPASFRFAGGPDLWVPIGPTVDADMLNRDNHPGLVVVGRLRPNVSVQSAQDGMHAIARQLAAEYPASNKDVDVRVTPLGEVGVAGVRPTIVALFAAVAFVLLLACVNVATLTLAAGTRRGRELAIRVALGASHGRLVRQLLTEHVLVAFAGGSVGVVLALWGITALRTMGSGFVPRADMIAIDWRAVAFAAVVSLLAGLGFGLAPALRSSRAPLGAALAEGGRSVGGRAQRRALRTLIGLEVALSLMLLIGAGLMIRSFLALQRTEPGLDPTGVLVANVALPTAKYPTDERNRAFFGGLLERLAASPESRSAGIIDPLPYGQGGWQAGVTMEGVPEEAPGQNPLIDAAVVSGGYFSTLGIPLLQGRTFSDADGPGSSRVVIVNRALAERYWPGQQPVGRRLHFGPAAATGAQWMTVVGMVGDVRLELERQPRPQFYLPYTQAQGGRAFSVVLKGTGDVSRLAPLVSGAVAALDPNQPVYGIQPMRARLADLFAERRFRMLLFSVFAGIALGLAVAGIYGVMSDLVSQRTREIGIRLALGAERQSIVRLVLAHALRPTLVGLTAGLTATLGLGRLLAGLLYGVRPADPVTFAAVVVVLFGAACCAAWLPALRATRVDPMVALRTE